VIARTDATDPVEALERAVSYAEAGADGVMVEAIRDLDTIARLRSWISVPIMVNQLNGGKSPNWRFDELEDAGASILICSTPCLFAAQYGIERYLDLMLESNRLPSEGTTTMKDCARVLEGRPAVDERSPAAESIVAEGQVFV
jgi:2-methylisocitrate lyase-like PEP mutase family enzyme